MDRLDFTLMTSAARARTGRRMSEAEIKSIVDRLADIAQVLIEADPEDKPEVFRQLGLKLTYPPGRKLVEANVQLAQFGFFDGVRGPIRTLRTRSSHPGHGVRPPRWWCAVTGADRVIRWTTAGAVVGVPSE
jgi:hypothetical protein